MAFKFFTGDYIALATVVMVQPVHAQSGSVGTAFWGPHSPNAGFGAVGPYRPINIADDRAHLHKRGRLSNTEGKA